MSGTVIQSQAPNKLCVRSRPVLHRHDLDHVQVWLFGRLVDGKNGIDDVGGQLFGERAVELRG
jgi:hypothetical protein